MKRSDESGQALIESFLIGLIVFVPLLWALAVLADLHRAALATTAAAREAGFDAARAADLGSAGRAVDAAVQRAFADHDLDARPAVVRFSPDPDLSRGAAIQVRVAYPVTVLQAPFLGRVGGPSIWVRASHLARVDPFRSR